LRLGIKAERIDIKPFTDLLKGRGLRKSQAMIEVKERLIFSLLACWYAKSASDGSTRS
jgi:hypothetical protein